MIYAHGGWWIIGLIALALFLLLVVGLIVAGIAYAGRGRAGRTESAAHQVAAAEEPIEILRRRYARGEITREEYQTMLEDLRR